MEHFAQLLNAHNAEIIKTLFELGSSFIAFMSALWVIWRRIKKVIDCYITRVDEMAKQFVILSESTKNLETNQKNLHDAVRRAAVRMESREKEILKLEGAMEATRKDMLQLVGAVQQTNGSLDGLWRALQTLFPTQVPKRASDR